MSETHAEHREMLRPQPTRHYPAPWRMAESNGDRVVVVCADGHYTCEAPSAEAAELIASAVNAYADYLLDEGGAS